MNRLEELKQDSNNEVDDGNFGYIDESEKILDENDRSIVRFIHPVN